MSTADRYNGSYGPQRPSQTNVSTAHMGVNYSPADRQQQAAQAAGRMGSYGSAPSGVRQNGSTSYGPVSSDKNTQGLSPSQTRVSVNQQTGTPNWSDYSQSISDPKRYSDRIPTGSPQIAAAGYSGITGGSNLGVGGYSADDAPGYGPSRSVSPSIHASAASYSMPDFRAPSFSENAPSIGDGSEPASPSNNNGAGWADTPDNIGRPSSPPQPSVSPRSPSGGINLAGVYNGVKNWAADNVSNVKDQVSQLSGALGYNAPKFSGSGGEAGHGALALLALQAASDAGLSHPVAPSTPTATSTEGATSVPVPSAGSGLTHPVQGSPADQTSIPNPSWLYRPIADYSTYGFRPESNMFTNNSI